MARVTVEDCIDKVDNRFELCLLAGHRARMISSGSQISVDRDNDKNPVVALREIAEHLAPSIPEGTEALAGLELGGVPIAVALSQVTGLPTLFVRKEAKSYGTAKLAEGGPVGERRITVVEDVVTSGGQVILSCGDLRERGADILGVLCVIDRQAGGPEKLAEHDLALSPLFTMDELKASQQG